MKLVIDLQGAQTESQFRGIGRQARAMTEAMVRHAPAHDIVLLLNRGLPENIEVLHRQLLDLVPRSSIKFFDIPGNVFEREFANSWRMRAAELAREAFIAGLKPDVVHVSSLFEGINDNAVTSIGLLEAPHATSVTLFDLIPLYDPPAYLGADAVRRFYYRRAQSLKRADLLLAISESARSEAVEMLNIPAERIDVTMLAADAKFRVVPRTPTGTALLRARYGIPGPFVLYVGAIEARKNVGLIIEAFGKLPAGLRGTVSLVFGGKLQAPERTRLVMAAVRAGVDARQLVFPGYIDDRDLPALYGLCDLFVFPSMHEGFGLPALEAMACGAPVLSARNSSLPEVMGRDDLLFGTHDPDELAAKMQRILTDLPYADTIRQWGVAQADRFSWDEMGRRAVSALERLHDRNAARATAVGALRRRPRLAFFSPLPADRSGIADYSSELLKELGCHYDVECVLADTVLTDPWVLGNFVCRDVAFFRRHAASYDRVVYCIGNSSFHTHMFELIERYPGVVILHDFFLSGVFNWLGHTGQQPPEGFLRELYLTHGLTALIHATRFGRDAAAKRFAANRIAFEPSLGVIVHSRWAVTEAEALYGPAITAKMRQLPLLRGVVPTARRDAVRQRLGLRADQLLVCSFGFVAETKLGDKLLEAWRFAGAGQAAGARLVYVGELERSSWGNRFEASIQSSAGVVNATVTGFLDEGQYADYLAAADLAVQLRTDSRGETSRAVLDCMAAGVPVIVNAHGPASELPDDVVAKVPDEFSTYDLAQAIDALCGDGAKRQALGSRGQGWVRTHHHPTVVGRAVFDAVEAFHSTSDGARQAAVLRAMQELYAHAFPSGQDFQAVATIIAQATPRVGLRRILFDVTLLAEEDRRTGIERVVRSMLAQLMARPPAGYHVEPVRMEGNGLRFARQFVAHRLGIPANVLPDVAVDYDAGDLYLMLEWPADRLPNLVGWLQGFRQAGGRVVIGINDLLPLMMPHRFPPFIGPVAERWFQSVVRVADQLVCISRAVADDVLRFGAAFADHRNAPIAVDHYRCGHDIGQSIPTKGLPEQAAGLLARLASCKAFLMVGTVEPRKGHGQVLAAFAHLWARQLDVALVIVGKRGWMVEEVEALINASPELGSRLFWLDNISDEYLERLYRSCAALVAASEGEGFGLPLVEAASHRLPVIARDLPVFREVAGDHAFYFDATSPTGLADVMESWLALDAAGQVPASEGMELVSWRESAGQLTSALFAGAHYGVIDPPPP